MPSRCVREAVRSRSRPGARQDGLGAARVGEARVALDEPVGDEAVDEAGDAALAQQHAVGQLAHPEPAAGASASWQQRVVLGERQVVLGAQLLVEAPRDAGVGAQERPPRRRGGDRRRERGRRLPARS